MNTRSLGSSCNHGPLVRPRTGRGRWGDQKPWLADYLLLLWRQVLLLAAPDLRTHNTMNPAQAVELLAQARGDVGLLRPLLEAGLLLLELLCLRSVVLFSLSCDLGIAVPPVDPSLQLVLGKLQAACRSVHQDAFSPAVLLSRATLGKLHLALRSIQRRVDVVLPHVLLPVLRPLVAAGAGAEGRHFQVFRRGAALRAHGRHEHGHDLSALLREECSETIGCHGNVLVLPERLRPLVLTEFMHLRAVPPHVELPGLGRKRLLPAGALQLPHLLHRVELLVVRSLLFADIGLPLGQENLLSLTHHLLVHAIAVGY
mmetsp:Transcript_78467/g.230109  ORF Transcript_78467/g.230109 Transcript_78467/m.230109 type:complete len:314 (-) Transcript_78467:821-1762(-)